MLRKPYQGKVIRRDDPMLALVEIAWRKAQAPHLWIPPEHSWHQQKQIARPSRGRRS